MRQRRRTGRTKSSVERRIPAKCTWLTRQVDAYLASPLLRHDRMAGRAADLGSGGRVARVISGSRWLSLPGQSLRLAFAQRSLGVPALLPAPGDLAVHDLAERFAILIPGAPACAPSDDHGEKEGEVRSRNTGPPVEDRPITVPARDVSDGSKIVQLAPTSAAAAG